MEAMGCPHTMAPLLAWVTWPKGMNTMTFWWHLDYRSCQKGTKHTQPPLMVHSGFSVGVYSLSPYLSCSFLQDSETIFPQLGGFVCGQQGMFPHGWTRYAIHVGTKPPPNSLQFILRPCGTQLTTVAIQRYHIGFAEERLVDGRAHDSSFNLLIILVLESEVCTHEAKLPEDRWCSWLSLMFLPGAQGLLLAIFQWWWGQVGWALRWKVPSHHMRWWPHLDLVGCLWDVEGTLHCCVHDEVTFPPGVLGS